MPENAKAWAVFSRCKNQHIMAFGGPVDLDLKVVFPLMDLYKIRDRQRCLELVHMAYHHMLEKMRLKSGD